MSSDLGPGLVAFQAPSVLTVKSVPSNEAVGLSVLPFSATVGGTTKAVSGHVIATYALGSVSKTITTPITIHPVLPVAVTLQPSKVTGGASATATVTLSGPAPAGGLVVTITADAPAHVALPSSSACPGKTCIVLPAGQTTSSPFQVTTTLLTQDSLPNVTAAVAGPSASAQLTVLGLTKCPVPDSPCNPSVAPTTCEEPNGVNCVCVKTCATASQGLWSCQPEPSVSPAVQVSSCTVVKNLAVVTDCAAAWDVQTHECMVLKNAALNCMKIAPTKNACTCLCSGNEVQGD